MTQCLWQSKTIQWGWGRRLAMLITWCAPHVVSSSPHTCPVRQECSSCLRTSWPRLWVNHVTSAVTIRPPGSSSMYPSPSPMVSDVVQAQNSLVQSLLVTVGYRWPFCPAWVRKGRLPLVGARGISQAPAAHLLGLLLPLHYCTAAGPAGVRRNTPLCLRSLLSFRETARQECLCLDISHSLRKPPLRFFTFSLLCSHNPDKWELGQGWM